MKNGRLVKRLWLVAVLAVAALALGMMAGDLSTAARLGGGIEQKTRVATIMPHRDDGYWTYVANGALAGAKQYAGQVDVKVFYPQLNYNIDQMTELIRRQIAAKVDAIIAQGNENPAYQQALVDAWTQGIRVVLVDTDITNFVPHLYIGTDNYRAGQEMGRRLAALTGGKAHVAVLSGQPGYYNLEDRYRGLTEIAREYPDIRFRTLRYDDYDTLTVLNQLELIRQEFPDVDTLVCVEGTGGQAIGNYYTGNAKPFDHVLAFDDMDKTLRGLDGGIIDGVVAQEPFQMGFLAVEELARNAEADAGDSRYVHTDIRWLTPGSAEGREPAL